jgi:hypothetical protein
VYNNKKNTQPTYQLLLGLSGVLTVVQIYYRRFPFYPIVSDISSTYRGIHFHMKILAIES